MNLKIDLQFFGGGGSSTQRIQKRDPEPTELTNLRSGIYGKIYPGLESYDANAFTQAQNTANNALQQQNNLLSQIPSALNQNNALANEIANVARTGNIPTALSERMNASVNQGLQNSMGSMLNNLADRGVVNSSITSQGISRLGQQAADAFNQNYLSTYNSVLGGLGTALQGQQNNAGALLQGLNAIGNIPSQAYEGAYAGLMPAFNFWNAWQGSYDNREDYDTIVKQGK